MSTTTPELTQELCIPSYHGQSLERATVLDGTHITTLSAALAGIHAVVDLLHDRESQRAAGEATHCPTRNMGLLAAVHSLTTLVQLHIAEGAGDEPAFIRDSQGLQELRGVTFTSDLRRDVKAGELAKWAQEQQAQHHQNLQPKQAASHTQQAQAATKDEALKPARRTVNTSAQPIQ